MTREIKESQRDPKDWKAHQGKWKLIKLPSQGPGSGVEPESTKWASKSIKPEWS